MFVADKLPSALKFKLSRICSAKTDFFFEVLKNQNQHEEIIYWRLGKIIDQVAGNTYGKMGKGNLKFGGKSGVLPAVRHILKNPVKPIEQKPNPDVGYAENVKEPRGSHREQKLPEVKTVNDLISTTVRLPKVLPTNVNATEMTPEQKRRVQKAQLRREYYIQSLKKEEIKLETDELREKRIKELKEAQEKEMIVEESPAAKLTLPTISSYLDGPLMRQRTPEETQLLKAKKNANRLNNELAYKLERASDLLQLYYSAENFITNETDLKRAIEEAFHPGNEHITVLNPEHMSRAPNEKIGDALFGTINNQPGLSHVLEQLSGERREYKEKVNEAAKRKLDEQRNAELSG